MDSHNSKEYLKRANRETATGVGLGLFIEGFIAFAMVIVVGVGEAISFFLLVVAISSLLGCCFYYYSKNKQERKHVRG